MAKAKTVERAAAKAGSQAMVPVVLSGGSGTRLWPLSRAGYPKQFLPLVSGQTMIQET
ncbi:sugar phosphate nucleotidyltransferase, partial [Inquilinus sp.]|uniref:sugar phosphate nucleotidyltransferase n=1 Tax=Inquilinus sp. TaxID=1932117 RepID=UPI0031D88D4F